MIKPILWLSLLSAILSADHSASTASSPNPTRLATGQFSLAIEEEGTEEQRISDEARRNLGRELLRL